MLVTLVIIQYLWQEDVMEIDSVRGFFAWCSLINIGVFIYWLIILKTAPNWLYCYSVKWVEVSEEQFSAIHFALLGGFKLAILFFNLVPYFALRLIS